MTTAAIATEPAGQPERLDPAFIRQALILLTGVLAVVLDTTIVNIGLETLGRDLHASVGTIQWATTGYLLAVGMAVPVTGWLLDRIGGKPLWLGALGLFLLASVGSSLATDATGLITFRVLQGVGGGLMLPVMQTLVIQSASGRALGRATAVVSLPVLLGPVLGPVLGGLIVTNFSWRWMFWVNIPLCLVGLFLAWRFLPATRPERATRLDVLGLVLVSPGIAGVVYGLAQVGVVGGFGYARVLVPLLAGLGLITVFTVRAVLIGSRALVDVRLFAGRTFSAATILLFGTGFVLYGAMLLVPLYLQQVRGSTAVAAGLILAPQGLGVLLSRGLAGSLTDRIGARWITVAGIGITALATVPFAFISAHTSVWYLAGVLVVRGIGLGAVTIPVMTAAYLGLERPQVPHASIMTRTAQQLGGSFGTAVLAVILQRALAVSDAVAAYRTTFWWAVGFSAIAAIVALWLPAKPTSASVGG